MGGNLKGLDDIHKAGEAILKLPKVMSRATTDAADLIDDVIQHDFDVGQNPYEEPWAPLMPSTIKRGRHPPPLTDTEALRAVNCEPLQHAGLKIEFDSDYATFHQTGTAHMAQRQLVPEEGQELPPRWNDAIVEAYEHAVEGWAKKLGWRAGGGRMTGRGG
jgi:hypothetical protein